MRNTRKILLALLVVMTLLVGIFAVTASAAAGETWTVAGSSTLCGSNWSTSDTSNDMTYDEATDSYVKVYYNVAAGTYEFKCAKDHKWDTAYPSSNYVLTVSAAEAGYTVTIILKGSNVTVKKEAPTCEHDFSGGNVCLESVKCSKCDVTSGAPKAHSNGDDTVCDLCGFDNTKTHTIYFKNTANWSVVNAHNWSNAGGGTAWPGTAMTKGADGLYSLVVPAGRDMIIFNNGSGTQTSDLLIPADNATYDFSTGKWSVHEHSFSDATCTEAAKCECGETQGEALGHDYVEGVCSRCDAADPDYVPEEPANNPLVMDFSKWEAYPENTYTEGQVQEYNEYFTFIHNTKSRIDGSSKSFDDGFEGTQRFNFGGKTSTGSVPSKSALKVTVPSAGTIKVWWVSGGDNRLPVLLDDTGAEIAVAPASVKDGLYITEFAIPAAGTYYLGNKDGNNYWFKVELALGGSSETPHVNTLVVGETNKIVVSGNFVNDYNLPIEWVSFVADENAHYSFVGDNGALAFIFDANGGLVSATGAANLEAGNYLICVGNGVVGEFNVAVTKSAWNYALAEGANKVLITDALNNGAGYYIAWATFEVTEKANYTFTGDGILALVYDSAYAAVSGTELDVGTYNICVAFLTKETTGVATVNVAKTAIGGGDVEEPKLPALKLGDNTVTIDGSQVNLTGTAVAWYTFTPETAGTYTLACDKLTIFILTSKNMSDPNAYVGNGGVAELEAGTTYYVLVGKEDVRGDFTVNVSLGGEAPAVNTIVVGENVYVINQPLKNTGFEFLYFTADKDGVYTFSGLKNLVFFIWPEYPNQATVPDTAPYVWNIDLLTGLTTDTVEVELTAATYLIGFKYVAVDEAGNDLSLVGEYKITVSFEEKAAHEHNFVEGKCECGETDPNYQPPVEEPELNPIQKIIAAITAFFAKISDWFKNLIGGLKRK